MCVRVSACVGSYMYKYVIYGGGGGGVIMTSEEAKIQDLH